MQKHSAVSSKAGEQMILGRALSEDYAKRVQLVKIGQTLVYADPDQSEYYLGTVEVLHRKCEPKFAPKLGQTGYTLFVEIMSNDERYESWLKHVGEKNAKTTDVQLKLAKDKTSWVTTRNRMIYTIKSSSPCRKCEGYGFHKKKDTKIEEKALTLDSWIYNKPNKPKAEGILLCKTCKGFG